ERAPRIGRLMYPEARVASGHIGFVFLRLPVEAQEPGLWEALQTDGEVGESLVVGLVRRRRTARRGRIEDVVHALDGEQQQPVGAPAALLEEHDRIERNGRE